MDQTMIEQLDKEISFKDQLQICRSGLSPEAWEGFLKCLLSKPVVASPRTSGLEGEVYFLAAPAVGMVKIGFSADPEGRLRELAPFSPVPLRILATIPGSRKTEAALHKRFAAEHSHHEWFHLRGAVVAYLEGLTSRSQDA